MKVIFLKDYKNNKKNEIKYVNDGFAKNFLIPMYVVLPATKENIRKLKASLKKKEAEEAKALKLIHETKEKLEQKIIIIEKKRTPKGLVEGSVTKPQLINKIKEELDVEVNPKNVDFKKANTFGIFDIKVSLGKSVSATLRLEIKEI